VKGTPEVKATLAGVIAVFALGIAIALWSMYPGRYLSGVPLTLALTLGVIAAAVLVRRLRQPPTQQRRPLIARRVWLVAVGLLVAELALLSTVTSSIAGELAYYSLVGTSAIALVRWCNSGVALPISLAAGVLVIVAFGGALRFGLDPASSEYGPERWLFAIWGAGARLTLVPLDASVAWLAAEAVGASAARTNAVQQRVPDAPLGAARVSMEAAPRARCRSHRRRR